MRKNRIPLAVLAFFLLLAKTPHLLALGALFVRPLGRNVQYDKMYMKRVDARVNIQDQIAVTHTDQVFFNELNTVAEAVFVFPLPEGAVITEMIYWFNGQRYVGRIRELQDAIRDYNQKIRQHLDPALLQYLGDNLFRLNIAPINPHSEVRFEITYTELLNYEFGRISYQFLLNTTALSPKPLERVSLTMFVQSQSPIKFLNSPSHQNSTATQITKLSDRHYSIIFGDENFTPDRDFSLAFETVRENVDIHLLTYTPTPADSFGADAFYALWITPPDSLDSGEIIPKNIVFTADVSSSMEGERLYQLKLALNRFLDYIQPQDRFNIISFGTHVDQFRPDLVRASSAEIAAAREYVRQLAALGLTNIDQALSQTLSQSFQQNTMNTVIFLTDGYPTWGETDILKILANVHNQNTHQAHIFSFGVGDDISTQLLTRLSQENSGYARFITRDDSIALLVTNHFQRISKPVLTDLEIEIPGLLSSDRFPRELPALFWGSQVLELGRYSNRGAFEVKLKGKLLDQEVQFSKMVDFTHTNSNSRFVPRLWARTKIDHLLQEIEIYGELDELVNAVIDLSLRFGILTRYTAFYADPDDPPPTSVDIRDETAVNAFVLEQNYPNPFNPSTEIRYQLPDKQASYFVIVRIYDELGRLVKELVRETQTSGMHRVIWDGTNLNGEKVPSGIYFCVLQVGKVRLSRKMLLMK